MKELIKFTKAQFHYIIYCKGWYDRVCGDTTQAFNKLHDKIYCSSPDIYAKQCFISQMIDLIPLERMKHGIINELMDDYACRDESLNRRHLKTFEDRLAYHVKIEVMRMPIKGPEAVLDMVVPFDELKAMQAESRTFESFYYAIDKYYDTNILPTI